MSPLLLDTCALIYYFFNSNDNTKLSNAVIEKIENNSFYILSISFAELECLVQKKRMMLEPNAIDNLLNDLKKIANNNIIDITPELWLKSIRLNWDINKDPCDRLVVAYAIEHDLTIVTSDQKIKDFYKKVIL